MSVWQSVWNVVVAERGEGVAEKAGRRLVAGAHWTASLACTPRLTRVVPADVIRHPQAYTRTPTNKGSPHGQEGATRDAQALAIDALGIATTRLGAAGFDSPSNT